MRKFEPELINDELYCLSAWVTNALSAVFPLVQAVVQDIFLDSSPGHLLAGEASGPVALRVYCHHPTQPVHSGLHVGQAYVTGCLY